VWESLGDAIHRPSCRRPHHRRDKCWVSVRDGRDDRVTTREACDDRLEMAAQLRPLRSGSP
jgi:hypothetical protein